MIFRGRPFQKKMISARDMIEGVYDIGGNLGIYVYLCYMFY